MWILLLILLAALLLYLLIVRPILKTQPALSAFFKEEASWWDQVQAKLTGFRTKIAARLVAISGVLVGVYDQLLPYVTGQDWTPLTQKVPGWVLPVGLVTLAWLFDWLRKITENPPRVITQKIDGAAPVVVDLARPDGSHAVAAS